MADETGGTVFKFSADTRDAEAALDSFGDKVTGIAKVAGAAIATYLSFKAVEEILKKSIHAAIEQEQAQIALNSALAITGQYTKEASESFMRYAETLSELTGVQDNVIIKNAATLVSIGKLTGEGLNTATKAALDLAAGLQIDVGSAFDIVTKATQGNVMALKKYGLAVQNGASDSQKFAQTLEFINRQFGGAAENQINTFGGAITKLGNSVEKVFEGIGTNFTNSTKFRAVIMVISDAFLSLAKSIAKVGEAGSVVDGLIDSFFEFGQSFINSVLKPIEQFTNFVSTIFMGMISSLLGGLGTLAGAFDSLFKTNLAPGIVALAEQWKMATVLMGQDSLTGATNMSDAYSAGLQKIEDKVDETASKISTDIPNAIATATPGEDFWGNFSSGFTTISQKAEDFNNKVFALGQSMKQNLGQGFVNAFAAMGGAIAKGQNAFDAFGKSILSTIGGLAIQLGGFLLLWGTGLGFVPGAQSFSAGAIAAGLGLILLGGALQAIGGASSGAGSSVGDTGGGGGGSSGGGGSIGGLASNEERVKPQTGVQVVVQGNVFDTRETGLHIAQIINDSFDNNGTIIRANA